MHKNILIISVVVIVGLLGLNYLGNAKSNDAQSVTDTGSEYQRDDVNQVPADKIEVVHFHGTQQCISCITVGKFAQETIEQKFSEEVAAGKIVFKEINGELPENQAIVQQYQARGSSLFINAIRGETNDIAEDVTVWRLINNQQQFATYFENKLRTLLRE